jgi:hypothetical protein
MITTSGRPGRSAIIRPSCEVWQGDGALHPPQVTATGPRPAYGADVTASEQPGPGEPAARPGPREPRPGEPGPGEPEPKAPAGRLGRLARLNTGGMLYGTIVAAAALAVGSGRGDTAVDVIDAMASTLVIYWLAHVYAAMVSGRRAGSATPLRRRIRSSARHESPILVGGLPPLVIFLTLTLAGVSIAVDAVAALGAAIGMFALDGFLAGRQAGVKGWRLEVEAGAAAVFGLMIAVLMVSLH